MIARKTGRERGDGPANEEDLLHMLRADHSPENRAGAINPDAKPRGKRCRAARPRNSVGVGHRILKLEHHLVEVKGRRLLAWREFLEAAQPLRDIRLCGK